MKRVLTRNKNLEHCVKRKMREIAESKNLTGFRKMNVDQLEAFLRQTVKGFNLRKNYITKSVTLSWFEDGKEIEFTYGIDPETRRIYEETNM